MKAEQHKKLQPSDREELTESMRNILKALQQDTHKIKKIFENENILDASGSKKRKATN
jgi:hypothetical protein